MNPTYDIPTFGSIFRQAAEGSAGSKVVLLLACLVLWLATILIFGYPAIIPAICMTGGMFMLPVMIING